MSKVSPMSKDVVDRTLVLIARTNPSAASILRSYITFLAQRAAGHTVESAKLMAIERILQGKVDHLGEPWTKKKRLAKITSIFNRKVK